MLAGASDMMRRVLGDHVQCPHRGQVIISVPGVDSVIVKSMVEMLYMGHASIPCDQAYKFHDICRMFRLKVTHLKMSIIYHS